jgi:hypothetical protein
MSVNKKTLDSTGILLLLFVRNAEHLKNGCGIVFNGGNR